MLLGSYQLLLNDPASFLRLGVVVVFALLVAIALLVLPFLILWALIKILPRRQEDEAGTGQPG